jgi:hypothetical protein
VHNAAQLVQREKIEIEGKIADTQHQIRKSTERSRLLRQERHALLHRISKATMDSADTLLPNRARSKPASPPMQDSGASWTRKNETPPFLGRSSCVELVPTRAGRRKWFDEHGDVPRPISSFLHMAPISFSEIAPFMPPSSMWYTNHHNAVSAAITQYQEAVCAAIVRSDSEVCWFVQHPFTVAPGVHLSHSSGAGSPECCLTLSLVFPCMSIEALFLNLEHEQLLVASDPAHTRPPHPGLDRALAAGDAAYDCGKLDALSMTPEEQHEPTRVSMRVGVNGHAPMRHAVDGALRSTLLKYRPLLPRDLWLATCHLAVQQLLGSLSELQAHTQPDAYATAPAATSATRDGTDDAEGASERADDCARECGFAEELSRIAREAQRVDGHSGAASAPSGPDMPWSVMEVAMALLMKCMLRVLHEVMTETPPPVRHALWLSSDLFASLLHTRIQHRRSTRFCTQSCHACTPPQLLHAVLSCNAWGAEVRSAQGPQHAAAALQCMGRQRATAPLHGAPTRRSAIPVGTMPAR